MLPEDELVERIRAVAGTGDGLAVGIGDDAAVLDGGFVVCCDMLVDGVHFDSSRQSLRQIGARAAAVNLSDLAAMGARPVCLLAAFGLPPDRGDAGQLAAGVASHGVPLAGGDLSRAASLTVSVPAVWRAPPAAAPASISSGCRAPPAPHSSRPRPEARTTSCWRRCRTPSRSRRL